MANAAGAPGHRRAILLVMPSPSAIESHKILSETKAVPRERYQYTFGSVPVREAAMFGSQAGSIKIAASRPKIMANRIKRKNWILTEDSYSFSKETGGVMIDFLTSVLPFFGCIKSGRHQG